ncbi:MAG: 50S ribosomal protein L11 methyltransferase [Parasporobacterium sp.]|nr:50S ribosomal protein L11 methyltransferase [Parasporobacterium sp.]
MRWTKYTIKTTTKDADMVSAILMDYDINDVQIENNVQLTDEELNQMYADFVKELPPDDGSCSLSFYVEFEDSEDQTDMDRKIDALAQGLNEAVELFGIEPTELICEDLNSDDWENNWKEFFKPFSVDRILIAPTWEELPKEGEKILSVDEIQTFVHEEKPNDPQEITDNKTGYDQPAPDLLIRIDPGMAFGTGTHETTRLCLRALQKAIKEGNHVLDLGCGSGILGIAAVKLGASDVVSVDIDEQAVKVAEENFEINDVPGEKSRFFVGNVVDNKELQEEILTTWNISGFSGYDIVVVNILADVINVMMPSLDQYLRSGGILITSGILNEKEQLIRDAVSANPNLELSDVQNDGDWVSITAVKK